MICSYSVKKSWYWQQRMLKERVPSTEDWKSKESECVLVFRVASVYLSFCLCLCVKLCTCVFLWSVTGTETGSREVTGLRLLRVIWLWWRMCCCRPFCCCVRSLARVVSCCSEGPEKLAFFFKFFFFFLLHRKRLSNWRLERWLDKVDRLERAGF